MDHRDELDYDDDLPDPFPDGDCEVCGRIATVSAVAPDGTEFEFCELHWGKYLVHFNVQDGDGYKVAFRGHSLDLDPAVCDLIYGEDEDEEDGLGE